MFPPFSQDEAKEECILLIEQLEKSGCMDFCVNEEFRNPKFSLDYVLNECGLMMGVLVCKIPDTNKTVVLKAFSGQYNGNWQISGWVNPCFEVEKWQNEVNRADPEIKKLTSQIEELTLQNKIYGEDGKILHNLRKKRKELSQESLQNIYGFYEFTCFDGSVKTYKTLQKELELENALFPKNFNFPTGTGDCCAPKLLNHAYKKGLQPISLAEFFYGKEPSSALKKHKEFYPPCDEKCGYVLPKMLGLEVLYRDEQIIVVNKPSGVLSVPGKGEDKFDCISTRVRKLIPDCIEQPSVHRLDMDTSGILVLGLTKESHRNLSIQFQDRKVEKKYQALLRGKLSERLENITCGKIEFPMRVDLDNRPYQIYDEEYGRMATTEWKLIEEFSLDESFLQGEHEQDSIWRTRVEFMPITGRTHQLRLHSAHEKGLGLGIVGDRLYGKIFSDERLCLQAFYLKFTHPTTNEIMEFSVPFEF